MDDPNDIWSDEKCIKIAIQNNFPSTVKDLDTQRSIINRFLNFYLSGNIPKGLTVVDVLFAVISIMPFIEPHQNKTNEVFVWEDCHYSDNGTLFFLSAQDKLQHDIKLLMKKKEISKDNLNYVDDGSKISTNTGDNDVAYDNNLKGEGNVPIDIDVKSDSNTNSQRENKKSEINGSRIDSKIPEVKMSSINAKLHQNNRLNNEENVILSDIKWFISNLSRVNSIQTNKEYGPVDNAGFCMSCNNLLENWKDVSARINLKYFFGVTALVLMRVRIKSFHNINNFFLNKFSNLFNDVIDKINYSPPNILCIKKCWKALKKIEPTTQIMYAKIVVNKFYINDQIIYKPRNINVNIFNICILTHAANFGMGIIAMLQTIAIRTKDFNKVFKILESEQTIDALNKLREYISTYMINSKQNTHHWSRLIDPNQFLHLCCKNNIKLAIILAAFIEKLTNSKEIWKSSWVKGKEDEIEILKNVGYEKYHKYSLEI